MRMVASRLTGKAFERPAEVVGWHLAMQAQDYGPAKWSIGQRSKGVVDAEVDDALRDGSIIRTHVLRPTWHFVAREDVRWLLALSGPRVQQGSKGRYQQLGLDARARVRAERLIVSALSGGNRLTRNELAAVLERGRFDREGQRLPWVLMHCELEAVIGSGGLEGKQQTYALLDERVPAGKALDRDDALVELTRRYLRSHGPATVKDMSWWSGLTMGDLRKALDLLGSEVASRPFDDLTLWSIAGEDERPRATRRVHLLQTYDELVVGFTESRFLGDPGAERARAAWFDRTYPSGTMLLDGRIVGHWRRTTERERIRVDAHLYGTPSPSIVRAVETAATSLGRFVGLGVAVHVKAS